MPTLAPALLALAAILTPARPEVEPPGLAAILPDAEERRRYLGALRRLAMRPITPARLAQRARLTHRRARVLLALRADPRFARVREPIDGPERYQLRAEHRHAARLAREARS